MCQWGLKMNHSVSRATLKFRSNGEIVPLPLVQHSQVGTDGLHINTVPSKLQANGSGNIVIPSSAQRAVTAKSFYERSCIDLSW